MRQGTVTDVSLLFIQVQTQDGHHATHAAQTQRIQNRVGNTWIITFMVDFTNDLMRDLTNGRIFISPKRSF
jgi:hypothetical protein